MAVVVNSLEAPPELAKLANGVAGWVALALVEVKTGSYSLKYPNANLQICAFRRNMGAVTTGTSRTIRSHTRHQNGFGQGSGLPIRWRRQASPVQASINTIQDGIKRHGAG
jgi:hypothetical protein